MAGNPHGKPSYRAETEKGKEDSRSTQLRTHLNRLTESLLGSGITVGVGGRDRFLIKWKHHKKTQNLTILSVQGYDWDILKTGRSRKGATRSRQGASGGRGRFPQEVTLGLSPGEKGGGLPRGPQVGQLGVGSGQHNKG